MKYFKNLALALVAFAFVACGSQSPSEVAKEFTQKIFDDKADEKEVLELMGSELKSIVLSVGGVNFYSSGYKNYVKGRGSIKNIVVEKEEITNDTARVQVVITFGDNGTEMIIYPLIKENGKWVIADFK